MSPDCAIATIIHAKLLEADDQRVTLLDGNNGDIVHQHLNSGLGIPKAQRYLNVSALVAWSGKLPKTAFSNSVYLIII